MDIDVNRGRSSVPTDEMLSSFTMRVTFEMYQETIRRKVWRMALLMFCSVAFAFGQSGAIDFEDGKPFSNGYVAGNTLYVAGQEGPGANGKFDGLDIAQQTANAIAAIEKV